VTMTNRPRDLARSALAFGASGGCAAGCQNCLYISICGTDEAEEKEVEKKRGRLKQHLKKQKRS